MSNKGAIKKSNVKETVKKRTVLASRSNTLESQDNSESVNLKTFRVHEGKRDGRKQSVLLPESTKIDKKKVSSNTKQPITSPRPTIKRTSQLPQMSKFSSSISSSKSHSTASNTKNSKIYSSNLIKDSNATINKDKSNERRYSEKRGTSTVYMPKTSASKLKEKIVESAKYSNQDTVKLINSKVSKSNTSSKVVKERRKSRTLSPSEIKMLHPNIIESDTLTGVIQDERAAVDVISDTKDMNQGTDDEYNYEDDFEEYESDFQDCTDEGSQVSEESNESNRSIQLDPLELQAQAQTQKKTIHSVNNFKLDEEQMHDSGHYELAEARKRAAKIESIIANQTNMPTLPELKQPVKIYSGDRATETKSILSSADEGFEDSRSGDFPKSPPLSQLSFIDFHKTKENTTAEKPSRTYNRGQEILEMIKLDIMEFSLWECSPIPYEEFIRTYGKLNSQQISTQTGEENLDAMTQTTEITCVNKWTQFPISCRKNIKNKEDIDMFIMEQVGVGSDNDLNKAHSKLRPSFDVLKLNEFIHRAGGVMLSLLEEKRLGGNIFQNNTQELPFSDGIVQLTVNNVTFLAGRTVKIVHYPRTSNKILLTIHSPAEKEIETSNNQDCITDNCIGCLWNILEPSMPMKLFHSPSPITACCFHLTNYNVVFAGLEDGLISLWDLKEDEMWHPKICDKANKLNWVIRTPTYITLGNVETEGHNTQIIALEILSKIETKSLGMSNNKFVPIQICSIDESGRFIIWSVLRTLGINIDDIGLSQWGNIKLLKSHEGCLQSKHWGNKYNVNAVVDMRVDIIDSNSFYIATNTSNILHVNCIGYKINSIIYKRSDIVPCGNATCIETCPFRKSCFLVGCDDGTIRLHVLNKERPILQLKDEYHTSKIIALQWSKSKPFIVFVLDNESRIQIWDLHSSDVHPTYSINIKNWGNILTMRLSPCETEKEINNQYLAFGTESGTIVIHKLKEEFCCSRKEDLSQKMDMFQQYIKLL